MTDRALERAALALFEAMLDRPEAERDDWLAAEAADRPDLLARVQAMRAADRLAELRTGGALDADEDAPPPERIGAYRIAERIGRGGMGSVYRAERATGDFTHVVAIKIIKPGLFAESLVARFQSERQTLARLSHPNIAQLYDGGEIAGGSPYIVMEYVDGLPLLQWVEAHHADRAVRRRLFLDICGAVAAAHRALIVHRDLTPSNVLVTGDGVVKLIDFGIAKLAEAGTTLADPGAPRGSIASLSLTPGYAAPERMTGAPVTTAADIYSLGKLLEKLIPPAARDAELRAIVARATAATPADRYPTADALAQDVAAWADGRAVRAMGGGGYYRLRKFLWRRRVPVAAAALALLLLVAAFVRAEMARADAERRFAETRAIAKTLLFETYDEVSRAPGSTRARAMLARRGLAYLDALAADDGAPLEVQVETGLGYLRLAQVTGGGQAAQLGRFEDANALLGRADAILAALHRRHPDDAEVTRALARLRVEQSRVDLYNNNDTGRSTARAREAQGLLGASVRGDAASAAAYAEAVMAEGDALIWVDDFARARDVLARGERFVAALPGAVQNDLEVMRVRATTQRLLGEAFHKLKQAEPARAALDRGVAIAEAMVRRAPNDPRIRRHLVTQFRYQAIVHRTNERDAEAREAIDRAYQHAVWLRDRDPDDAGALHLFALVAEVKAQILGDLGLFPQSFAMGDEVIAAISHLARLSGNTPGARRSLATAYATRGGNYYNGGAYADACRSWDEARRIFEALDRQGQLSDTDRNNGLPQMRDFLARGCNPPRAGLEV